MFRRTEFDIFGTILVRIVLFVLYSDIAVTIIFSRLTGKYNANAPVKIQPYSGKSFCLDSAGILVEDGEDDVSLLLPMPEVPEFQPVLSSKLYGHIPHSYRCAGYPW